MRALMPKYFTPCLTVVEYTDDGYAEVWLDVNGHLIGSRVFFPNNAREIHEWAVEEIRRRA